MRIAMFVDGFPMVSESFILRQIMGLLELGHEVDIYAQARPHESNPTHPQVIEYGLLDRTIYLDMPPESYSEMPVWPITGKTWVPGSKTYSLNAVRLLRAIPKLIQCMLTEPRLTFEVLDPGNYGYQTRSLSALYRLSILSSCRKRYDVLHAQFGNIGQMFQFARSLWNVPLVVSFRGQDFSSWPRRHGRTVYKRLFDLVDAITVNTEFARRRVEELGCVPHKIHKVPSALNLDEFPFHERTLSPGEQLRILTVGRLVEKKGIEYSIQAVAKVRKNHPELRYDIIGDGPLRSKLENLSRQLGIGEAVIFHGARDGSYVKQMMSNAHLFVLASVTTDKGDEESLGNVLTEAQASGLPVLVTAHNGFPETIAPDRSGFLVPERDVDGLADRLTYLIETPKKWPEMGRAGRAHVERHYDMSKLRVRAVELYEDTIANYLTIARKS
jgi:colanic acid/amylovoran biosynthesis glycosyltransferase